MNAEEERGCLMVVAIVVACGTGLHLLSGLFASMMGPVTDFFLWAQSHLLRSSGRGLFAAVLAFYGLFELMSAPIWYRILVKVSHAPKNSRKGLGLTIGFGIFDGILILLTASALLGVSGSEAWAEESFIRAAPTALVMQLPKRSEDWGAPMLLTLFALILIYLPFLLFAISRLRNRLSRMPVDGGIEGSYGACGFLFYLPAFLGAWLIYDESWLSAFAIIGFAIVRGAGNFARLILYFFRRGK